MIISFCINPTSLWELFNGFNSLACEDILDLNHNYISYNLYFYNSHHATQQSIKCLRKIASHPGGPKTLMTKISNSRAQCWQLDLSENFFCNYKLTFWENGLKMVCIWSVIWYLVNILGNHPTWFPRYSRILFFIFVASNSNLNSNSAYLIHSLPCVRKVRFKT